MRKEFALLKSQRSGLTREHPNLKGKEDYVYFQYGPTTAHKTCFELTSRIDDIAKELIGRAEHLPESPLEAVAPARDSTSSSGTDDEIAPIGAAGPKSARQLQFRSKVRRFIQLELTRNPIASNLEICRALDDARDDGGMESWGGKWSDVSFARSYMDATPRKRKIEKTITAVRREMRKAGLLPPKKLPNR